MIPRGEARVGMPFGRVGGGPLGPSDRDGTMLTVASTKGTTHLAEVARILELTRAALRKAAKAGIVETTVSGAGTGTRYDFTDDQFEAARALICIHPDCSRPAPTVTGRCKKHARGRREHLPPGHRAATELALRCGVAVQTITAWARKGLIDHTEFPGPFFAFSEEAAQRLEQSRCSRSGCDNVTPFDHCWKHRADEPVERVCKWCGDRFFVKAYVAKIGKGQYCSQEHNMRAQSAARPDRFPGPRAPEAARRFLKELHADPVRQSRWNLNRHRSTKVAGRRNKELAAIKGNDVGPPRQTVGLEGQVREMREAGMPRKTVAFKLGITPDQVRYAEQF